MTRCGRTDGYSRCQTCVLQDRSRLMPRMAAHSSTLKPAEAAAASSSGTDEEHGERSGLDEPRNRTVLRCSFLVPHLFPSRLLFSSPISPTISKNAVPYRSALTGPMPLMANSSSRDFGRRRASSVSVSLPRM